MSSTTNYIKCVRRAFEKYELMLQREAVLRSTHADPVQQRILIRDDLELNDALAAWRIHTTMATMYGLGAVAETLAQR